MTPGGEAPRSMPPMNRREALKATTALLGGALALAACGREPRQAAAGPPRVLTPDDQALVEEIADTLLPTTAASPGAKAAGAGPAINLLLTDCWEPEKQQRVVAGLKQFRTTCDEKTNTAFEKLPAPRREAL